jgi:acetyl esterase
MWTQAVGFFHAPLSLPTMTTSLLSPRMAGVLERIHRAKQTPFHALSVEDARRAYWVGSEVLDLPRAPLPRVEDLDIPLGDPVCRARLYAPSHDKLPVLLYLHGGGFTVGGLGTHDSLCRQLALQSHAAVLALDYRLAPEHRFPAAVNDVWDSLQWLAQQGANHLGLDEKRLAVGGDSAGGTLAAVSAIQAAQAGLALRAQLLITPGTADNTHSASHHLFANGFLLEATTIAWFFDHYIDRHARADWRFAPLNAPDVDGVAPAVLVLAECDPLVDEGLAYADKLRAAGVSVELELTRGVTHDFIKMGRALPQAVEVQAWVGERLRALW